MVEKVIGSESYDSNGMIVSVGDYTIRKRKKVGFMEVILGTREDCAYGYMVALLVYHSILISVSVDNPVVVKSYSEAMRLFVMTVNEAHLHLERQKALGQFAHLRREFLEKHRRVTFVNLLTSGKLTEHLYQIEQEAMSRFERLTKQLAQEQGVTEELKARDQMMWIGRMNNIRQQAEEVILSELIYS